MRIASKVVTAGLVLTILLLNTPPVAADTHQWNVASGDWHTAGNWSPTALPGSGDTARIYNGGTADYHAGDVYTVSILRVEGTGSGQNSHMQQDGGTLTASNVYVGYSLANTGTYQLSGGYLYSGYTYVGLYTAGTFTHSAGTHQISSNLKVGGDSSGAGTYAMSGSASLSVGGSISVGESGTGTFNQSGGTANNGPGTVYIGRYYGSDGAYNLSGGSLYTQTVDIGSEGTGVLDWTGGNLYVGTAVSVHTGGTMTVGQDWDFTRAITVDGGELDLGMHALGVRSLDSLATCTLSAGSLIAGSIVVSSTTSGYQGTFTWTGGTLSADTITVHPGGTLAVGADKTFSGTLNVNGGTIEVASGYTLTVTGTFGETDNDHKTITKTGDGTLVIQGTQSHLAGATLAVNAGKVVFKTDPGAGETPTYNLAVTVGVENGAAATVEFESTQHLAALTLNSTSTATLKQDGSRWLFTKSLGIAGETSPTATLDLTDNKLVIDYGSNSSPHAAVYGWVKAGANLDDPNHPFQGNGITSSTAAADQDYLHAVGWLDNDYAGDGSAQVYEEWFGQAVGLHSILVMYTYFGDALLTGDVDSVSYAMIDNGYNSDPQLTGWVNGDFNYDGVIDSVDYALIDNVYNMLHGRPYSPSRYERYAAGIPELPARFRRR